MTSNKKERGSNQDTFFVQSIDRALNLVDTISKNGNTGMTLLEISSCVELPTSTVYRLLQNLLHWKYVSLDEKGKYFLGLAFLGLGRQVSEGASLVRIAKPYLDSLNEKSGETIYLSVFDEEQNNSLHIDKRSGRGSIQLIPTVGAHNEIYCSANGKALLYKSTGCEIRAILSKVEIVKKTKNTITDIDTIIEEILLCQKNGYAVDIEEGEYNVACIAAPVLENNGKVAAAVSISGLVPRIMPPQRFEILKGMLLDTTNSISKELGYNGDLNYNL